MTQTSMTYAAFLYLRIIASSLPRNVLKTKFISEDPKAKKILIETEHLKQPSYDLFQIHTELSGFPSSYPLGKFERRGREYEYLSSDGKIRAVLSETCQTIFMNIVDGHVQGCDNPDTCNKPFHFGTIAQGLVLQRKGFIWKPSLNSSRFVYNHEEMMYLFTKIAFMPDDSGEFKYCLGGTSIRANREMKPYYYVVGASLERLKALEDAEKLVVPVGREKAKKFSRKKAKQEDGNEHEQTITAEISGDTVQVVVETEMDLSVPQSSFAIDSEVSSAESIATTDVVPYNPVPSDDEQPS